MSLSVIIDYKVGNLHNLKNALDYLKLPVAIVEEPEAVRQADRILFPGVGAFGPAMQHLRDSGLLEVMEEKVQSGTPLVAAGTRTRRWTISGTRVDCWRSPPY